jgi:hypothetical protein
MLDKSSRPNKAHCGHLLGASSAAASGPITSAFPGHATTAVLLFCCSSCARIFSFNACHIEPDSVLQSNTHATAIISFFNNASASIRSLCWPSARPPSRLFTCTTLELGSATDDTHPSDHQPIRSHRRTKTLLLFTTNAGKDTED